MAVVTVATMVGNMAVMVALRRVRRIPMHYPLASLALADLLLGICVLPIAATRDLFEFQLHRVICAFWSTMDVLCCTASILSLSTLGWERWCAITSPLARAQRLKKARLFAALVWPVSTLVAMPTAFVPSPVHFHPGEPVKACTVNTNTGYVFFSITFSFYLPGGLMVVLYGCILRALAAPPSIRAHRGRTPCPEQTVQGAPTLQAIRQCVTPAPERKIIPQKLTAFLSPKGCHLNIPGGSNGGAVSSIKSPGSACAGSGLIPRQRRATRTIVMLMSLFLFCWTPFFIMLPADSICDCVWDTAWQWCTWVAYANSALNPMVYAAASPSVRRALRASFSTVTTSRSDPPVPLTPNVRRATDR